MLDATTRTSAPAQSLVALLEDHARNYPQRLALTFLFEDGTEKSVTYAELDRHARAIAAWLQQETAPGERALLLFPPGLDFIGAFFGCLYAGVLGVPTNYPRPKRPSPRLDSIAADAEPEVVLTTRQTLASLDIPRAAPQLEHLSWGTTDGLPEGIEAEWSRPELSREDLAFLQYTSGSTSAPKGVMVSHGNLLHNLESIRRGFQLDLSDSGVFWLPAYHDMGLIGGILTPLYVGGHTFLMAPTTFLRRPITWLETMSRERGTISGAPNFAYELCARKISPEQREALDLSSWRLAFCGAEPIRPETLESFTEAFGGAGFRDRAFYPCYGLAEGTLLATGGDGPRTPRITAVSQDALSQNRVEVLPDRKATGVRRLVACGRTFMGQEVAIVDPETCRPVADDRVGEIWLRGPSIARGYWDRPEENEATFNAILEGDDGEAFLRTGDLGFVHEGELYVTGRLKDMVIIRGRNLYPQDIEHTIEKAHPALLVGATGAFSVDVEGEERLVAVAEVDRRCGEQDRSAAIRAIRRTVVEEHEVELYDIVLIRIGSLPRTSSGKVQRHLCRDHYENGELTIVERARRLSVNGNGNGSGSCSSLILADQGEAQSHRPKTQQAQRTEEAARVQRSAPPTPFAKGSRPASPQEISRYAEQIEGWLLDWLVEKAGVPREEIDRERAFAEFGLDSLTAVELSQGIEDWLGVKLTPVVAWNYPTPAKMARYLAEAASGEADEGVEKQHEAQGEAVSDFERLLAEIEGLSDDEAQSALSRDDRPE